MGCDSGRASTELRANQASQGNSPALRPGIPAPARSVFSFSYTKALLLLLIFSLPLVNPWIHGDGVGYYAYAHSLLIDHDLQFENEWRNSNESFAVGRVGPSGQVLASQYTTTQHLDNHFSVGPAILWAPFLVVVHAAILALKQFGAHLATDGFSRPYLLTMALSTALYGFLGLWLSFQLARQYVAEKWAFLATVGYWFASSLPVYMYLNPSWSHAHTLFSVALFLWYWNRKRGQRTLIQWVVLGLLAALMVNVYYLNLILLMVPGLEALVEYGGVLRDPRTPGRSASSLLASHLLFAAVFLIGMLPTLITRRIIYGGYFETGYPGASQWFWTQPVLGKVLFSSDHGLLTWTPILVLAILGIVMFRRFDRKFAFYLWGACLTFYYVMACYVNWDGITSFGNRFFISLGPIFIIGLAAFFSCAARVWRSERKGILITALTVFLFVAWNVGFIFQWGAHLIPVRGNISWRTMTYNQFFVVPGKLWDTAYAYIFSRKQLLQQIEKKDMEELNKEPSKSPKP